MTLTVTLPLLLPLLTSPPPVTVAVLEIDAGAFAAMLTLTVIAGAALEAAMAVPRTQLTAADVDALQSQPVPEGRPTIVKPAGIVSLTV